MHFLQSVIPGRREAANPEPSGLTTLSPAPKLAPNGEADMFDHGLMAPVVALILWSLVMLVWLYALRIPALSKLKVDPEKFRDQPEARDLLPVGARRAAANYNHLMEQPTLFYAVCFALQLMDQTQPINIWLAWTYVGLRVLHSLVQGLVNIIRIRFSIFAAASIVLMALALHAGIAAGLIPLHLPHG